MVFWMFHGKDPLKINRIAAKLIDYLLFYVVVAATLQYLPYIMETLYYLLLALVVPLLWAPLEALLISSFKTTPGKALFGIRVHDILCKKLSFSKALRWSMGRPVRDGVIRQVSLSVKRRFAGLCIGLACIGLSLFGNTLTRWTMGWDAGITTDGWVQYESEDAGFSVQFPNDPKEESKKLPIPAGNKTLSYQELTSAESKHVHYSVSYMNFPSKWKWAGTNTLLKGAIEAIVKHSPGMVLISREFSYHQTHRALDFHLKQGNKEIRGRLIIVGTTLYKLTITYPEGDAELFHGNPFIPSFDLQ